jgi:hypothetical protein
VRGCGPGEREAELERCAPLAARGDDHPPAWAAALAAADHRLDRVTNHVVEAVAKHHRVDPHPQRALGLDLDPQFGARESRHGWAALTRQRRRLDALERVAKECGSIRGGTRRLARHANSETS